MCLVLNFFTTLLKHILYIKIKLKIGTDTISLKATEIKCTVAETTYPITIMFIFNLYTLLQAVYSIKIKNNLLINSKAINKKKLWFVDIRI